MPGAHCLELVWEVAREDRRSAHPDRPQKQVARNATVRRLDHCTVFTSGSSCRPAGYRNRPPNWEPVVWQMPEPGTASSPSQFSLNETFGSA